MSGTNKQTRGKREWRSPNKVKERHIPKFIRKRYIDKLILGEGTQASGITQRTGKGMKFPMGTFVYGMTNSLTCMH